MALCALTYFPKSSRPTVGAHLHPPHCFIQPPLAFIHCGFTPLFFKPRARRRDPYQNTVETEHNHASSGGGGEYTGRRVDDTMQVIHAEVLLKTTTLDLESVFFLFCFLVQWKRGVLVSCAAR